MLKHLSRCRTKKYRHKEGRRFHVSIWKGIRKKFRNWKAALVVSLSTCKLCTVSFSFLKIKGSFMEWRKLNIVKFVSSVMQLYPGSSAQLLLFRLGFLPRLELALGGLCNSCSCVSALHSLASSSWGWCVSMLCCASASTYMLTLIQLRTWCKHLQCQFASVRWILACHITILSCLRQNSLDCFEILQCGWRPAWTNNHSCCCCFSLYVYLLSPESFILCCCWWKSQTCERCLQQRSGWGPAYCTDKALYRVSKYTGYTGFLSYKQRKRRGTTLFGSRLQASQKSSSPVLMKVVGTENRKSVKSSWRFLQALSCERSSWTHPKQWWFKVHTMSRSREKSHDGLAPVNH